MREEWDKEKAYGVPAGRGGWRGSAVDSGWVVWSLPSSWRWRGAAADSPAVVADERVADYVLEATPTTLCCSAGRGGQQRAEGGAGGVVDGRRGPLDPITQSARLAVPLELQMTPLHPRGGLCAASLPVALADGQLKLTALPHRRRRLHTHCRRASATLSSRVALQRPRHTQIPPCTSRGRHRRAQPPSARLVVCSARPRFPGRQPRPGLRPRHRPRTCSAELCGTAPCSMQLVQ